MRLRNSFWGLLGQMENSDPKSVTKTVREVMLAAIDEHCGSTARHLDDEISQAMDLATLWYLRPELMKAIATTRGETIARDCMISITKLFNGYRPDGQ